jgi:hypothetical protein
MIMKKLRYALLASLLAGAAILPAQSQAFFGWMSPWNWGGPGWGDYYYPYGYSPYSWPYGYHGYPYGGWGAPYAYGYPAYWGAYPYYPATSTAPKATEDK